MHFWTMAAAAAVGVWGGIAGGTVIGLSIAALLGRRYRRRMAKGG